MSRYLKNGVVIKERLPLAFDYRLMLYAHETAEASERGDVAAKLRGIDSIISLLTNVEKPNRKHRKQINEILAAAKRLNQSGDLAAGEDAAKKLLSACAEIQSRSTSPTVWQFMENTTGEEASIMALHIALVRIERIRDAATAAHPSAEMLKDLEKIRGELDSKIRDWYQKRDFKAEELEQPEEHALISAVFGQAG